MQSIEDFKRERLEKFDIKFDYFVTDVQISGCGDPECCSPVYLDSLDVRRFLSETIDLLSRRTEEVVKEKNNAYWERNQLVTFLSKVYPSHWYRPENPVCCSDNYWNYVVCIELPTGQATWHINEDEWKQYFAHLKAGANNWDGHSTKEKYDRLRAKTLLGGEDVTEDKA